MLLVKLPPDLAPHGTAVAEAYAEVLGCRAVLEDGGVAGPLREPVTRPLLGASFETTHVENGVRFRLDPSRVMFSSGNVDDRTRFPRRVRAGEVVVDLFAGIGYWSVPIAVHARPARVVACELSPVAHGYLVENVKANGVAHVVEPRLGDCRDVAPRGVADRVLLGYLRGTADFLPTALQALRPEGGVLHYHEVVDARGWREHAPAPILAACPDATIEEVRRVKSYGPGSTHVEVVARVAL